MKFKTSLDQNRCQEISESINNRIIIHNSHTHNTNLWLAHLLHFEHQALS